MNHSFHKHATNMTRKCIGSYAFFDLETTGLPDLEFNKTKITEICLVACSRENILKTERNSLPRVLNKLSFCVNPFKLISPESSTITGLDNFLLEYENKFDKNSVKLLNHFILQLPQPVCLVAHNGDKFDFPIIQKQLKTLELTLPDDLCCVDSLPFFKLLEEPFDEPKYLIAETKLLPEAELHLKNGAEESMELLSENKTGTDMFVSDKLEVKKTFNSTTPSNGTNIEIIQPSISTEVTIDDFDENSIDISLSDEDIRQQQKRNESTPSSRKIVVKQKLYPKTSLAGRSNITPPSKRQLFTSVLSNPSSSPSKRIKFTLNSIHERLFGMEPKQSHYAEGDTLALIKCAIASKEKFIEYAEVNATFFKDIKPMGTN